MHNTQCGDRWKPFGQLQDPTKRDQNLTAYNFSGDY